MTAGPTGHAPDPRELPDADRGTDGVRIVLCAATLAMLGLSWPLWITTEAFPRVPFLRQIPTPGQSASWAVFVGLLASVAAASTRRWRVPLGLSLAIVTVLVLQDQHRFQPWLYQYMMIGLILLTLPGGVALKYARWWFVALYLHSGLSKLDVSFCREMGPIFLRTAVGPMGLDPGRWSPLGRDLAILAMPAGEIAVAAALAWPRSRRLGRAGAVALHATLLGILGPAGLGHSTIVLVWNAALIGEVWAAFGPDRTPQPDAAGLLTAPGRLTRAVFWVAAILPLGERRGLFDAWPSHALYASHVERTFLYLHEAEVAGYPAAVRDHVAAEGPGPWRLLRLTEWSRSARGVPVYPQARACNGLAEALAVRYGGQPLIRVIHEGRADRWTGARTVSECLGSDAIRRQGDRYRLNAHPAGSGPGPRRTPRIVPGGPDRPGT